MSHRDAAGLREAERLREGPSEELGAAHCSVEVRRWQSYGSQEAVEDIAVESPVAVVYNGEPFAVMLATPLDLEDFALGFSLTEGVIADAAELQGVEVVTEREGFSVYVSVPRERVTALANRQKSLPGRSGCGLCGEKLLENAVRPAPVVSAGGPFSAEALQRAVATLSPGQKLNTLTGAVHAAAWADAEGQIRFLREDVGRHNALDKLIGALIRARQNPVEGFALITSRASYELVHKSAVAGISLLAAVSAPTSMAVRAANQSGLTLAGFTRMGRHTLYTHFQRIKA
jgi:FdhD protein